MYNQTLSAQSDLIRVQSDLIRRSVYNQTLTSESQNAPDYTEHLDVTFVTSLAHIETQLVFVKAQLVGNLFNG